MDAAARCVDLESLASYLGLASQHIFYLVEMADDLYFDIEIPKRSKIGGKRKLSIPTTELKGVQRIVLGSILEHVEPSEQAYAYIKGKSVIKAAKKLCGNKSVLKLDIKDFFPTISARRVFGLYRSLGFNNSVSYILTRLTTLRGAICQGAPTSPYISNLICRKMDDQLNRLAMKWDLRYLRYSDDMFFYRTNNFSYRDFQNICDGIITEHSFSINQLKCRYYPKGKPRFTLGLATHGKYPQIPREQRRKYRAAFYKASRNLKWAGDNLPVLAGMAEWHKSIYGTDATYSDFNNIIKNVKDLKLHDPYAV